MYAEKWERWNERKLSAPERPKVSYEYYVTGKGSFPFDMLRYDSCWPASGEEAAKLNTNLDAYKQLRSIRMRSHAQPTIDRWSSFGWSVGVHNLHSVLGGANAHDQKG